MTNSNIEIPKKDFQWHFWKEDTGQERLQKKIKKVNWSNLNGMGRSRMPNWRETFKDNALEGFSRSFDQEAQEYFWSRLRIFSLISTFVIVILANHHQPLYYQHHHQCLPLLLNHPLPPIPIPGEVILSQIYLFFLLLIRCRYQ